MSKVLPLYLEEEMKSSYLNYAMSVIVSRALPDVRDGLKPVQRRILYAMHELGLSSTKPHKKSARVTGETLGKYHPHGDVAVYDAIVRMAQNFSLRYPLIDGQGNFGSVDGDPPAAMRYTEVRLSPVAEELLQDLDKKTVDFVSNFDNTLKEPVVLPAKIPNLLLNGSSGIAVGMATNIPPHNLNELVDACIKIIDNPDISLKELLTIIEGPDFPTGGIIVGEEGIKEAYEKGRGKITLRGKVVIENKEGKENIIITELPYQVNKANLVEKIANLSQNNRIIGIKSVRDESDRKGIRIVIETSRRMDTQVILNQLYRYTPLQVVFGIILLALVDGKPRLLNLLEAINLYLSHREEVIRRRSKFLLDKERKRAHLLEGFKKVLERIEMVINLIKSSPSPAKAKERLIKSLNLTETQAQAILDMRLQRLTALEREKIDKDYGESLKKIKELEETLHSKEKIKKIIKRELLEVKEKYGDTRRTLILKEKGEEISFEPEDLIEKEDIVITLTSQGYIKYTPLKAYKHQRRGGKGVNGIILEREDLVSNLIIANTHSLILFFTSLGRVYWVKAYDIPQRKRSSRGRAIVNFLPLKKEEKEIITAAIPIESFNENKFLIMITKKGLVKKTPLSCYSRPFKKGINAIRLKEEDKLIKVLLSSGEDDIFISTKKGKAILFSEKDLRPLGRVSLGVKGISLREDDQVINGVIAKDDESVLTITSKGFGKRTLFSKYRKTKRGGKGIINIRLTSSKGEVVGIKRVKEDDDIVVITKKGKSIRLLSKDIPLVGRSTTGSRIIKLEENDEVKVLA
ncbi:DNA gyrase subunit A [Candidatus Aerophobetes bacterium]|nr:DNA gyrase subunit A [Candidatus Aerophobetes bacterium]